MLTAVSEGWLSWNVGHPLYKSHSYRIVSHAEGLYVLQGAVLRVSILKIWPIVVLLGLAIGGLVIASALGVFQEALGEPFTGTWVKVRRFLTDNGTALDQLWKVLGGLATILSGCWAIYKSWRYAESNLPKRIEEFLQKCDKRLEHVRPILLATIQAPRHNRALRLPVALVGPLNDALRSVRLGKVEGLQSNLAVSIELLTKQKEQWRNFDAQISKQLVAARMMQGTALAAQASMKGASAGRKDDQDSYRHFDEAAKLDETDPEPVYYRGRQSLRLGQMPLALEDFSLVERLTAGTQSIIRARALYSAAQLVSVGAAVQRMAGCIAACPNEFKHTEEFGEMNEFRGNVQEKSNFRPAAMSSYQAAATIYVALNTNRARDGLQRVQEALRRLQHADAT